MSKKLDMQEGSDTSSLVVCLLCKGTWRVINCKNNIQWILQRRVEQKSKNTKVLTPWRPEGFFLRRDPLIEAARLKGATKKELLPLTRLPDMHPDPKGAPETDADPVQEGA